ncbi:MAG: GH25 family lysozyme [Pseudonocardiales bacterium]
MPVRVPVRATTAVAAVAFAATCTGAIPTAQAASAPTVNLAAPVTHPQDDRAGSTIVAHEGRGSPATRQSLVAGSSLATTTTQTLGMDVSHYQGTVDWGRAYANGARFAYIKATESTTYTDPMFTSNYTGARAAGLVRGAYAFALPDRSSGAVQADYLLANGGGLSPDGMTLPPMLDIEYNPYGATCYGLSASAMVMWIRAFSDEIHAKNGRYPTIYTTTNWWGFCTGNDPTFGATNPLFVARYNTTVGTLPAGWSVYTMWQYADAGVLPGDQDTFNGTLSQLKTFARGCPAGTAGASLPPSGMSYDFSGDGQPDVISRSPDGLLRLYYGAGSALSGSTVVGCGWNAMTAIFSPGDFNGDGHPDIIARTPGGLLLVYYWDGGRFGRSVEIGHGWSGFTALFSPGDFNGDGHPDVIGRTAAGDLLLYAGTGAGLGVSRLIGVGWNVISAVFSTGDFNGDRHADVIGRISTGALRLYTGTGYNLAGAQVIGIGWGSMSAFDGSKDFTGDGHADLVARSPTGSLILYRGNGVSLSSPSVIGIGWTAMTALS